MQAPATCHGPGMQECEGVMGEMLPNLKIKVSKGKLYSKMVTFLNSL